MYKKIIASALFTLMLSFTSIINAETLGYEAVTPAQPTKSTDKIEVIEFFWYGCPHCYSFEPFLSKWAKTLPKNVEFIRQPAVFSELWGKHAKAYFTAEALGVVDKVHSDLFDAVQAKQALETEDELAKFFAAHGVKESDFRTNYNSFLVDAKMRQAKTMAARYGVNGVPAIIVNGKYRTNATLAGSQEKMIDVINQLIKQESSAK
ncbi:MAG: thiol:disulfide interchange protein DsbA/DsbL [Methylococcaceae bacterium]|nr:thiol:disulfide interchange protein DsbA/DsbL [Methylococcaceae bacterium]